MSGFWQGVMGLGGARETRSPFLQISLRLQAVWKTVMWCVGRNLQYLFNASQEDVFLRLVHLNDMFHVKRCGEIVNVSLRSMSERSTSSGRVENFLQFVSDPLGNMEVRIPSHVTSPPQHILYYSTWREDPVSSLLSSRLHFRSLISQSRIMNVLVKKCHGWL